MPHRHAFLSIGFRPFYLGAAVFATLAVPYWIYTHLSGAAGGRVLAPMNWHIHEMLFGFAPAVIVGFLLTAVRSWTGRQTLSGTPLAALFSLWVAGRVLVLVHGGPLAAMVDLCFLAAASVALAAPLVAARNLRNLFVIGVLLLLLLADLAFYAALFGWLPQLELRTASVTAVNVISLLLVVIAGRVIPAFSANAVATVHPPRWPALQHAAIGTVLLITAVDLHGLPANPLLQAGYHLLLLLAATLHLLRLWTWQSWRTWRNPLLVVLPLAYLWIPVYFLLRATLDGTPGQIPSLAIHTLVVGAMAGLMLGMMTRSARGHTGRPLRAGPVDITCFVAIHAAALVRVALTLLVPQYYLWWLLLSAALWAIAFGTFVAGYAKILLTPRFDPTAAAAAGNR